MIINRDVLDVEEHPVKWMVVGTPEPNEGLKTTVGGGCRRKSASPRVMPATLTLSMDTVEYAFDSALGISPHINAF